MLTDGDKHAITFNGEVYNYRTLRASLEARGARFRTGSDTEVLLQGFAMDGPAFFSAIEGMFAAALWDGKRLVLVRDRFGMKPLFFGTFEGQFMFASEPKALLAAGAPNRLRSQGLLEYLLLGNPQGNESMFAGIAQLPPGTWASRTAGGDLQMVRYWDIPRAPRATTLPWPTVLDSATKAFERTIQRHLVSDVPVGIYLSGGIDSSLVAAGAAREGARLHSFSLNFTEVDDRLYMAFARRLATKFAMQHEVVKLPPASVPALLRRIVALADEPLADAADVAIFALSRAASNAGVKVVLTGDGGDEVFGGYRRHHAELVLRRIGPWLRLLQFAVPFLGDVNRRRVALMIQSRPAERYAAYLMSVSNPRGDSVAQIHPSQLAQVDFDAVIDFVAQQLTDREGLSAILAADLRTILPDTYLRKADRGCMMAGVEGRLPFLDRELVELAFSLPKGALVRGSTGKLVLRRLLDQWIPDNMSGAKKMGFEVPVRAWLVTPELSELRASLTSRSSPLRGLIRDSALEELAVPPANTQRAANQWKLLRLGLWAERWLLDYPSQRHDSDSQLGAA
jgi:asparagine synthase (glutamine-hydrolysing)